MNTDNTKARLKTNVHPNTDGTKWGWVGLDKIRQLDKIDGVTITWEEGKKSERHANLFIEAYNCALETGLSPIQMKERIKELEEALEKIKEIQMETVQLARTTKTYLTAENALNPKTGKCKCEFPLVRNDGKEYCGNCNEDI